MSLYGPILVFVLLAAPAVRLLALARRTRKSPEMWCGLYFAGAAVGIPLRIAGGAMLASDRALADTLNTIGHLAFAGGALAMAIFTCLVFRAASRWGRALAAAIVAGIVGTTAWSLLGGYASVENSWAIVATNVARILPTGWAFIESTRYWRIMRRRESLGLADPVLTNRFGLWSIWTGAVTLLPMVPLVLRTIGIFVIASRSIPLEVQLEWMELGLVPLRILFVVVAPTAAIALSLSFFPPARYLGRIGARAADRAAPGADGAPGPGRRPRP